MVGIAVDVDADSEDGHALFLKALLQLHQRGHFLHARRAPRSPEVEEYDFPVEVAKSDFAVGVLDRELGSRCANSRRPRAAITARQQNCKDDGENRGASHTAIIPNSGYHGAADGDGNSSARNEESHPMRIRFITSTPMNVFGGSGTFVGIATLAKAITALGVTVDLVVPKFNFPIYTVKRLLFNQWLRFQPRDHCDVTVGFDMDGYTVAGVGHGLHVASIKGVIADEMRFESGLTRATMGVQAKCEQLHVHRADSVITTSRYAAERIQELYGLSYAPSVIPELIDLAGWRKLSNENPGRPDSAKFVVLSVCRFYPRKRLNILLGAAERLRAAIPRLSVRIVGGGPEIHRLQSMRREKGLQDIVTWQKDISQSELASEYNSCDVFCLPSVQEGFGLVFLEAMARGKAIVAARSGAVPEVARHSVLVEPDSVGALAEAIELLYRNPALRVQVGTAGLQFVQQFDAPVVAKQFMREIEIIAERKTTGAR